LLTLTIDTNKKYPRIILLSNLLTWSGRRYHIPISCNINEFTNRIPAPNYGNLYKLENKFYSCSIICKLEMFIISVGLLYGGSGFDFQDMFK
jgi:hypothetical protein